MSHKYDEDTEYHPVAYHTILCRFILFLQGDSINSEYRQQFKEHIEVLKENNGRILFGNSLGATTRKIKLLGLYKESEDAVEKDQTSERRKYLATAFLFRSDRRRYRELI